MKINKILVIEKYTSFEYSKKKGKLNKISQDRLLDLEQSHKEHIKIRDTILEILTKRKIEFKLIKDDEISSSNYLDYDAIMSLGGDGTALHAMSNISHQVFFGINTDKKKSLGKLTKLSIESLEKALDNYIFGKQNIDFYNRLFAEVNGEKCSYLAVNEILIAEPRIYKTTHLEVELNGKKSSSISNGIIITTSQGSSAFYKSSGAQEFSVEKIGYNIIMPFNLKGELIKSQIIEITETLIIKPKREHYKLIFDCSEKKSIDLHHGDIVKVGIDEKDKIKIIV